MLRISPPSLQTAREFISRAALGSLKSKTLILVPGLLMRTEVERYLLAKSDSAGGIEVLSLTALAGRLAGEESTSDYILLSVIVGLLLPRREVSIGSGYETTLDFARALHRLFEVFDHSKLSDSDLESIFSQMARSVRDKSEILSLYKEYKKELLSLAHIPKVKALSDASKYIEMFGLPWDNIHAVGFYSLTPAQAKLFSALKKSVSGVFNALLEVSPEGFDVPDLASLSTKLRDFRLLSDFLGVFEEREIEFSGFENPAHPAIKYSTDIDSSNEALSAALYAKGLIEKGTPPDSIAIVYPVEGDFSCRIPHFLSMCGVSNESLVKCSPLESPIWQLLDKLIRLLQKFADPSMFLDLLSSPCVTFSEPDCPALVSNSLVRLIFAHSKLRSCENHLVVWRELITEFYERTIKTVEEGKDFRLGRIRFSAESFRIAVESICNLLHKMDSFAKRSEVGVSEGFVDLISCSLFADIADTLQAEGKDFVGRLMKCQKQGNISVADSATIAFESILSTDKSKFTSGTVKVAPLLLGRQLLREHVFIGGMNDGAFPFKSSFLPLFPEIADHPDIGIFDRLDESIHLYYLLTRRPEDVVLSYSSLDGFSTKSPSFFYYFEKGDEKSNLLELPCKDREKYQDIWENANLGRFPVFSKEWRKELKRIASESKSIQNGIVGARTNSLRTFVPMTEYSGDLSTSLYGKIEEVEKLLFQNISVSDLETYSKCPLQFFFKRVARISQPFDEQENLLPPDKAGTLIHDLLHHFYKNFILEFPGKKAEQEPDGAERILRESHKFYVAKYKSENYPTYLVRWLDAFYQPGAGFSGMLKQFLLYETGKQIKDGLPPEPPTYLEYSIKATLPIELGGFRLVGRIDRIDPDQEALWVVDYKTGGLPGNKDILSGKSLQLQTYALMLESKLPGKVLNFCHYIFKPGGRKYNFNKLAKQHETIVTALTNARVLLPVIASKIRAGVFNRTFEDDLLKECSYSLLCSKLCSKTSAVTFEPEEIPEEAFMRNRLLE